VKTQRKLGRHRHKELVGLKQTALLFVRLQSNICKNKCLRLLVCCFLWDITASALTLTQAAEANRCDISTVGVRGSVAAGVGYSFGTAVTSIGNNAFFGDPMPTAGQFLTGLGVSMGTGGLFNGALAASSGNNFWSGNPVAQGRGVFSLNNTPKPSGSPTVSKLDVLAVPQPELKVPEPRPLDMKTTNSTPRVTASNEIPYQVTPEGVVIPANMKYQIPSELIESPYTVPRSTTYGIDINGNFKEILRIDAATMPGYKGPNFSHYHLYGTGKHYVPTTNDPGFITIFRIKR
jgi:hypothetical protein